MLRKSGMSTRDREASNGEFPCWKISSSLRPPCCRAAFGTSDPYLNPPTLSGARGSGGSESRLGCHFFAVLLGSK